MVYDPERQIGWRSISLPKGNDVSGGRHDKKQTRLAVLVPKRLVDFNGRYDKNAHGLPEDEAIIGDTRQ